MNTSWTYGGQPLVRQVEFEVEMHDNDGVEQFRAVQMEREVRLTLAKGQRWPDTLKRGRSVDFEMGLGGTIYRMTGRVRFRRMHVAVIQGRFSPAY